MGCANSKLDDLPAVALCRERCGSLDEAIRQRYALSQSHLSYIYSLKTVGASLNRFFVQDLSAQAPASPLLNLPPHRKSDPSASPPLLNLPKSNPKPPPSHHHHSHSNSGSHLHFHSDDEDDSDGGVGHHGHGHGSSSSGSLHHDDHSEGPSSPLHQYGPIGYPDTQSFGLGFPGSYPPPSYPGTGEGGGTFMHMNFMRKQTTPSVSYQQRPMSPEIVRMGEASSSSSSYYPYPYAPQNNDQNPSFYPPYFNYPNYGTANLPGSSPQRMTSYYGSSSTPAIGASSSASTSKEPPPPPSPPRASAWEFLNPFESFDKYYPPYTPSRDSREVREEEGIPDLEEEDYQQEVVKEVHGHQKFVDSSSGGGKVSHSKESVEDEEEGPRDKSEALYRARPSASMESDAAAEYEVHMVDKKVVGDEDRSGNAAGFKTRGGGFKGDTEVVRAIQVQFERASESGIDLAKILEVGKLPHNRKHAAYQVSSKMLQAITSSLPVVSSEPSTSTSADIDKVDPALSDAEVELNLRSKNLSSTLQKLHLWEKKLYEEVKVEEKMRILHENKCRKLKRLDERGAEAHKVDATRAMVRSLSTKIRIAIQVVDKISVKINRLRDEELWPQLHEFIQGLAKMWKSMLECHRNQCLAIGEAKRLDAVSSGRNFSEAHIDATSQFEHDVINWTVGFSSWIKAQKGFVRALNNWLMKCLLYVPEETPDGIAPFSPGRIGAPAIFVICNQWSQAFDRVSEKEVLDTMRDFATSVLHLWEQDKHEMRQRMTASKDAERKIKNLEREDQKLQKEIQALDKKMVMVSGADKGLSLTGNVVYQSDTSKNSSLQVGLQRIFEAMERFTASSLKVYEELLQRINEDLAQERDKVS